MIKLKALLSGIEGVWDDPQQNKKVLRLNGGVMNWYETTGTIYFQGVAEGKRYLESRVRSALYLVPERKRHFSNNPAQNQKIYF